MHVRALREHLHLSRAELARFLGVSEATVVRWESDRAASEPRGLQAVLLRALQDAAERLPPEQVARTVRSSVVDHLSAIRDLIKEAAV